MRPFAFPGLETLIRRIWPGLGLIALLAVASAAYWAGLSGGFLFDDFVNLDALGATGPVDNWPTFWRYITSGTADPTGRPLALLSFLIDAQDWPADPAPFLRTNLILHLLNGALLFALLRQLGNALQPKGVGNDFAALLGAGIWLLHPLLVSTTLYIVQREAMLPTLFTLIGLLAYTHGRERFRQTGGGSGAPWMIAGVAGGLALALLSKGNGILLPMLAWVLELTVYSAKHLTSFDADCSRRFRRLKFLLLVLPSSLVIAYLASHLTLLNSDIASRPWTMGQRLLTEPRVLLDYLRLLFVPRSISTGLYNDAYPVSIDLWHPATTLPAIALVSGLVYAGFRWRRRAPRLAAAILFFFAGHLLESSVIPLELYFEHRNYLPALLLFWPFAHVLCSSRTGRAWRVTMAVGLIALLAFTTWQRAALWGQPDKLAALWALQNPESSRAQATQALTLIHSGQYPRATALLGPLWRKNPDDVQIAFNYIDAACRWRGVTPSEKAAVTETLRRSATGQLLIHQWLGRSVDVAASGACPGLALGDVAEWIAAGATNPGISPAAIRDQTIEPLMARLEIHRGNPQLALEHFNRALSAFTTPDAAARNVGFLASAGYYSQAMAHLDFYERIKPLQQRTSMGMPWLHSRVLEWQGYWPREMAILRAKLEVEIAAANEDHSPESSR